MRTTGNNEYCLDTNVVIDLFKGKRKIAEKIDGSRQVYLPITALGELYLGVENSQRQEHHLQQVVRLLSIVKVLHTTNYTAKIYGKVKAALKQSGKLIPENDIWISSLALENSLPLVTNDNHFDSVYGIDKVVW